MALQIFHNKANNRPYTIIPLALIQKLNNTFTGDALKVMLTYLSCTGDGSFAPSTEYMLKMTGISNPGNFYRIRKQLINQGYITYDATKKEILIDVNAL